MLPGIVLKNEFTISPEFLHYRHQNTEFSQLPRMETEMHNSITENKKKNTLPRGKGSLSCIRYMF